MANITLSNTRESTPCIRVIQRSELSTWLLPIVAKHCNKTHSFICKQTYQPVRWHHRLWGALGEVPLPHCAHGQANYTDTVDYWALRCKTKTPVLSHRCKVNMTAFNKQARYTPVWIPSPSQFLKQFKTWITFDQYCSLGWGGCGSGGKSSCEITTRLACWRAPGQIDLLPLLHRPITLAVVHKHPGRRWYYCYIVNPFTL